MKRFTVSSCAMCCALPIIFCAGILLFIVFAINSGYHKQYLTMCPSNLKQIALGIYMYDQDYDGKLPPAIFHDKNVGWANGLQPYLKTYDILQCPIEKNPPQKVPQPDQPGFTDYWLNSNIAGLEDKKVIEPIQLIMLGDGDGGSPESTASYAINHIPKSWLQLLGSPAARHKSGANYAFGDGHVKWLEPDQVSQLPSSKKHPVFTFVNK